MSISRAERQQLGTSIKVKAGHIDVDSLIPILACCGCLGVSDLVSLYLKFPDCCGCFCQSTCCCCSYEDTWCRTSEIDNECCVLRSCRTSQIMPHSCISSVCQCCVFDVRYSYPSASMNKDFPCALNILGCNICLNGGYHCGCCKTVGDLNHASGRFKTNQSASSPTNHVMQQMEIKSEAGVTEAKDLHVCCALCCDMTSLFCKMPDVFGADCKMTMCCYKQDCLMCKPAVESGDEFVGDICICCSATQRLVYPRTCVSCGWQQNCIDRRCAFPCDGKGDVPCVVNICFINFCYDWRCACGQTYFHTLGDVIGQKSSADKELAKAVKVQPMP